LALDEAGRRVVVVNTGDPPRSRPNAVSVENAVAVVRDAWRVWQATRHSRPRLVAIHSAAAPLLPAIRTLFLVLAGRLGGAPVVVHLHGDVRAAIAGAGRAYGWTLGALASLCRALVAVTAEDAEALRSAYKRAEVAAIENCVDCERFRPPDIPPDGLRAVFVGVIGRRKGVHDLLEALRRIEPGLPCDIVGEAGPEGWEVEAALQREGTDLVERGLVVFHGQLDTGATVAVLQRAAIFVLPSYAEALSVALLEAMACGLPSVVTDVGVLGTRVQAWESGLVVAPGDVAALAGALGALASDPETRLSMGRAGRRAVEAAHCCHTAGADLAELYSRLSRSR
jgi:glycosyltransferase involved in cell wall biosynthesis